MNTGKHAHLVGSIVPAGYCNPRWLYVTKVEGDTIHGRRWTARSGRWTKGSEGFARDALYKMTPRCPKPLRPKD